jgi:hypothetical protein
MMDAGTGSGCLFAERLDAVHTADLDRYGAGEEARARVTLRLNECRHPCEARITSPFFDAQQQTRSLRRAGQRIPGQR